jgi:hypothetical protein
MEVLIVSCWFFGDGCIIKLLATNHQQLTTNHPLPHPCPDRRDGCLPAFDALELLFNRPPGLIRSGRANLDNRARHAAAALERMGFCHQT